MKQMKRKKKKSKQPLQEKQGSFGTSFGDLLKQSGIETPKSSGSSQATPKPAPAPAPEPEPERDPFDLTYNDKIVVRREKKGRGGKTVTVVRGLELHADELMLFAQELRKQLGCGSSVEDSDLIVQGDQRPRIKTLLEAKGAKKIVVA